MERLVMGKIGPREGWCILTLITTFSLILKKKWEQSWNVVIKTKSCGGDLPLGFLFEALQPGKEGMVNST